MRAAKGKASRSAHRLERLRAAAAEAGIRTFFVRDTSNIHWLTAFDGVFDEECAHALLVTPHDAVLHTDSRYAEACRAAAAAAGGVVSVDDVRKSHAQWVSDVFCARHVKAAGEGESEVAKDAEMPAASAGLGSPAAPEGAAVPGASEAAAASAGSGSPAAPEGPALVLGIETSLSLAEYRALERSFAEAPAAPPLRETSGFVVALRAVKDADEIARMKAAQAITDAAFSHIVGFMRPDMTEREVQIELEDFMRRHGAEGLAFPSIVACGANGASPHAVPGETRLEVGQCVVMDFGARAHGYCSDMTRTVFLGEPSERLRAGYDAIRDANERVEAMLRPGVTGREAHELAERVLADHGFAGKMGHSLGHGVGIDIHEEPLLSPRNECPLVAGNVVTVEPGIYLAGDFGMRLEDFGVITECGYEVFTASSHDPVVL